MSHTPGPWSVGDWIDSAASISASRWEELAIVYGNEDGTEPFVSEGAANARLIAAAPELLDALRDLLRDEAILDDDDPKLIATRFRGYEAVRKAEGK